MKITTSLIPLAVAVFAPLLVSAESKPGAPKKPPGTQELPELPEALRTLTPSKRNHEGTPAARLQRREGLLLLSLSTAQSLTPEQWDAVASLHVKAFAFNDQALSDKDMDRLVALDPERVSLRITPLTGAGAGRFGAMKNLRSLQSHHMHQPTPEAREAFAQHANLEEFRTAGEFCIEALHAPHLKYVELAEKAATAEQVRHLAKQPDLETLSLFAHNILTVDDACLAEVAKIKTLKTVRLSFVTLHFEGGLSHLLDLPRLKEVSLNIADVSEADLQKLKAARPDLKVNFTPMNEEYRNTVAKLIAKQAGVPTK